MRRVAPLAASAAVLTGLAMLTVPVARPAAAAGTGRVSASSNVRLLDHVPTPATPVTGGQGFPRSITGINFINYPPTARYRDVMFGDGPLGLAAWSLADPAHPRLIGRLPLRDLLLPGDKLTAGFWEGEHLQVDGRRHLVFLTRDPRSFGGNEQTGISGIYVINADDPSRPRLLTFEAEPAGHTSSCINGCRYLWTGGPFHSGTGHQPKTWVGQPVWVTGVQVPQAPYTFPHPVDLARNDGATDYVHATDVDGSGIAWTSGEGGVHGFFTSGQHRDPLSGRMRTASATHPVPYAGGKVIQQPEKFLFDHNATHLTKALGGYRAGDLVLVTDEDFSASCQHSGRLLIVSLAGSYGAQWLKQNPDPRLRVVGQWGPVGEPGFQPSTFCSAHWFDLLAGVGDGNLLVQAFYGQGTRFIDYGNPRHPTQVGFFAPAGKIASVPKFHDGLIYAASYSNGIDVLRFTPPTP